MAGTKAKLPQSTIDGVLGVLALRAGSGKEAPSDKKGTESTRVPDSVSGSSKKPKKVKPTVEENKCPSGAAGSDGSSGAPFYTWSEYEQIKRDFGLADEEAYQVLKDLNGPPPASFEKQDEPEKKKKKKGKEDMEEKEQDLEKETVKTDAEETKKEKKKKKKHKMETPEEPENSEKPKKKKHRTAPGVEEPISPDVLSPDVLPPDVSGDAALEPDPAANPEAVQPKRRRSRKSPPEEGPLTKMYDFDMDWKIIEKMICNSDFDQSFPFAFPKSQDIS